MDDKLKEFYYQPNHMWSGNKAIEELKTRLKVSKMKVLKWVAK